MSTSSKTMLNPATFPRPPACEKTSRHLTVTLQNGTKVADTKEAYWVLETYHPPTYYLPASSLLVPKSKSSARSTYCEWKGFATYWDIEGVKGKAWSYEDPSERFKALKGYLSFYAEPWECQVDGEVVVAQPGDFYGGWMTSDIQRESVKGAPGTRHW
ncbi:unnamed protein product [Zymoseptoria tritici ST99CH_3D1]|nr:unnamed protein product [Zymoseptoria tritici ST99CH_3D1]